LAKDAAVMATLRAKHFTVGLTETLNLGAVQLFPLLAIPRYVITKAFPLDTGEYMYLGHVDELVERGLPGEPVEINK
jgi:hypothetical protein